MRPSLKVAYLVAALSTLAVSALAQDGAQPPGDAAAGMKVFTPCRACHQIGERARNLVGPELNGVIGRPAGSITNYNYSPSMKSSGLTWDETNFRAFIHNPKAKVPGTKMSYMGIDNDADITNLIAYLKTIGPDGKPR